MPHGTHRSILSATSIDKAEQGGLTRWWSWRQKQPAPYTTAHRRRLCARRSTSSWPSTSIGTISKARGRPPRRASYVPLHATPCETGIGTAFGCGARAAAGFRQDADSLEYVMAWAVAAANGAPREQKRLQAWLEVSASHGEDRSASPKLRDGGPPGACALHLPTVYFPSHPPSPAE